MELVQWFFMGVIFTVGVFAFAYLSMLARLKWHTWAALIIGALAVLFGIAWAGASFLEGVPRSGAFGLIFFSGTGLILLLLAWRYRVKPALDSQAR